jgi:LCP family protein required for cell wall assembly
MKKQPAPSMPFWLKLFFGTVILACAIIVSVLLFMTVRVAADYLLNVPLNQAPSIPRPNGDPIIAELPPPVRVDIIKPAEAEAIPTAPAARLFDSSGRFTILIMGLDRRSGETIISRTDTMMVMSFDQERKNAFILSIPRDLYVDIPGYRRERINTAFVFGALNGGELGGAQLAMDTVRRNLGIQVDHYLLVDFDAVMRIVDDVGGVMVDVPFVINDPTYPDMNYGYDPLYINQGLQRMDGELALKYMRTRHGDNDFARARRQQQLLFAFRDQVLANGLSGMLQRGPSLYNNVRGGLFTDLSVNDLLAVAETVAGIGRNDIATAVLDYTYVYSHTTPSGASVLILRTEAAAALIRSLYSGPEANTVTP